jgi:F-type H+-transporting ATPase subunit epsilon
MAALFKFELVSPEDLLLSEDVQQVLVPGTEGNFTVLPGHAPVLSTMRPGVIDMVGENGSEERIYVRGGIAEVNPKGLTVLAEEAVPLAELSPEMLAQQVKNAEEDVADATDDEKRRRAQEALDHLRDLADRALEQVSCHDRRHRRAGQCHGALPPARCFGARGAAAVEAHDTSPFPAGSASSGRRRRYSPASAAGMGLENR